MNANAHYRRIETRERTIRIRLKRACVNHPHKWAQSKLGLCRQCEHEVAHDLRTTMDRERERIDRADRDVRLLMRETPPMPPRSVTLHGCDFEIVWDGSIR